MDRLLLLMTSRTYRARAFLEAAHRLGVPVTVGTDRPQVLSGATPGTILTLDFSAPEAATQIVVEFADRYPIQAVVATDDDGVLLAAMASAALGLAYNSVDAVLTARNKERMREILARAGLLSPLSESFSVADHPEDVATRVSFPCVVKPLFLSASRGVMRADTPLQFTIAFRRLAALLRRPEVAAEGGALAQKILVESYIPGAEVALEGILLDGRLRVLALFDKPDPLEGPLFEESIYVTPSRLSVEVQEEVEACTVAAVAALGLCEGPVHVELRINDQGPWILEVAPRSIGGLCSKTLRFGDGMGLEELLLRRALGLEIRSFEREELAAGVMMIPIPEPGVLREVWGQEEAERVSGIEEIRMTIPLGQELVPLPEGARYLGFIFARNESADRVEAALRKAHGRLRFIIAPPGEPSVEERGGSGPGGRG